MRFLVTGGCGFIGSAVVRALADTGAHVLNVDRRRRTPNEPQLAAVQGREGYARLEADASDRTLMRAIFREFQPDRVIHLTSSREETGEALFDAEIGALFAVLEASRAHIDRLEGEARDAFRIVCAQQAERDDMFGDAGVRDAVRSSAATLAEGWARGHSLPLVTCFADQVFGPWQSADALPVRLCRNLLDETPFGLPAAGETVRDWLPVRDFAHGLVRAAIAGEPLGKYDFSVGAERRDLDVAETLADLLDSHRPRVSGGYADLVLRAGADRDAWSGPQLDATAAEQALGWEPHGFHAGLERFSAWLLRTSAPRSDGAQAARLAAAE